MKVNNKTHLVELWGPMPCDEGPYASLALLLLLYVNFLFLRIVNTMITRTIPSRKNHIQILLPWVESTWTTSSCGGCLVRAFIYWVQILFYAKIASHVVRSSPPLYVVWLLCWAWWYVEAKVSTILL